MSEFSEMELVAFANAGALATVERDADAGNASRPFDESTTGFTYAQAAAAVLLESADSAASRGATPLAELAGASVVLDGSSGTEADAGGEARALRAALATASIDPAEVAYVNTHGSGTPAGDRAECEAIRATLGTHPRLNSTKAITGHTMSAAGIVELVATVIQMRDGFLHPNPRLETPIAGDLRFTGRTVEPFSFDIALSNSFSIGGFNTCVAVRRWDAPPRGRA